jgi:hypothetical protein
MFLVAVTACVALAVLLAAVLAGVVALACAPVVALSVAIRRRLGVGASNSRLSRAVAPQPVPMPTINEPTANLRRSVGGPG